MPFHTSFDDEARLVVLYYLSRGFSRNGILRLLIAKLSKHYTDFQVEKMIITHNLRQEEERKVLLYDTQRQGQEWDLDAVDGVISSLGSSLISGRAYELMIIERDDEMTVLNVSTLFPSFLGDLG